jgi:predicted nucleic acid-binding protein
MLCSEEVLMKLIRIHYLDASAIVKLFIAEEGSDRLQKYFSEESNFYTTSLCFAEALGALKSSAFTEKKSLMNNIFVRAKNF